ncbi:hypothetical protein H6F51_09455 [Cyanobacteria bacterium FACHB-DQ100]|nr:hypothetical protein [Cyanobacteria bacterium FACHB-DQ100]
MGLHTDAYRQWAKRYSGWKSIGELRSRFPSSDFIQLVGFAISTFGAFVVF